MADATTLDVVVEVVRVVELAVCLAVSAVLGERWWRRRAESTGSALALFVVVALVLLSGYVEPADRTSGWGAVWSDAVIAVLLTIPYLLVRFTWMLGGIRARLHAAMAWLLAAEVAVTVAFPPLPAEGEPQSPAVTAYIVFVLAAWSVQSVVAAVGLWRAGRGQSSVVRHRMRSLSAGAVLLAATLILSGAAGSEEATATTAAITLLGLASVLLFALAFLLPSSLRLIWRQRDLAALSVAERGLMRALTRDEVALTIVPTLADVFGGAAALLDGRGRVVLATEGMPDTTASVVADESSGAVGEVQEAGAGVLAVRLARGWLVVQAGRLAPVFGDDEAVLLARVAALVDLALERVLLFEQERVSREAAESANADLETLLYSVSHDLRSPLISVLGYLDVLEKECAVTGDALHYVERIEVNAVYMQSLISDLLELSRVGRTDAPAADALDLDALARDVVEAAVLSRPAARVEVIGQLPVVRMSDVRARQLLTNLVDNALKHGGRDDLHVTISAERRDDGGVVVQVADDGRGVPAEYRERILRVFERLDAPKSSPGTGMGLAICKRIAESVGGSLTVGGPPERAATGTTMSLTLPASVLDVLLPAPRTAPLTPQETR